MRSNFFKLSGAGKTTILSLFAVTFITGALWGQSNRIRFASSGSVDWEQKELSIQVSFDLAEAGIKLPAGRFMGEEILNESFPRLLRSCLLSTKLDSSSTIQSLVNSGSITLESLDRICAEAKKTTSLSADLSRMTGRYTISLGKVTSPLLRQARPNEALRPLVPVQTADYTGIIIVISDELPVRGRQSQALAEPCLFPKIWDTEMNLVYEPNMFEGRDKPMVAYTAPENIFHATPSGLKGELLELAGANPLRIIAREVFGVSPTDPVIDREDALKILSSENNRRLLREGRVVLVLNNAKLKGSISAP